MVAPLGAEVPASCVVEIPSSTVTVSRPYGSYSRGTASISGTTADGGSATGADATEAGEGTGAGTSPPKCATHGSHKSKWCSHQ